MKKRRRYVILPALCLMFLLIIAGCNNAVDDTYTSDDTTSNDGTVSEGGTVDNPAEDADSNEDPADDDNTEDDMNTDDENGETESPSDDTDMDSGNEPEENTDADDVDTVEEVQYTNDTYGFRVQLPDSWEGYTVIEDTWESNVEENDESGPQIALRHPEWTEDVPRQDIPILVFTMDQWADIEAEAYNVSGAPVPPTELNRNSTYVFALPPRYNFAFPEGYEEVEDIIDAEPVETFEIE